MYIYIYIPVASKLDSKEVLHSPFSLLKRSCISLFKYSLVIVVDSEGCCALKAYINIYIYTYICMYYIYIYVCIYNIYIYII